MTQFCAPDNISLLNPNEFRFFLHRAPYLTFFVQTVFLPTISLGESGQSTPFTDIPVPGDHIDWNPLIVQFLVDEDLKGYQEMYNWMNGLGFPDTFEEYEELRHEDIRATSDWSALTSDISVFTNTGHRNANIEFTFQDAWPSKLTAPKLDTTNKDQPVVTCLATFAYTTFKVKSVKTS
jgi:hypothetical protein